MANNKNYFEFLDIPDGSGGSDRWNARDAEAQAGIAQVASAIGVDTDVEFVNLGLPSGTLWAKCNVGATEETGYGNYYMYGKGSSQYNSSDSEYEGTEDPLDATKDTATQVIGTPWHMPTKAQCEELMANTTFTWETNFNGSGVNGGKFTAANGNYVFFPAAGNYTFGSYSQEGRSGSVWTSTPATSSAYMFAVYLDGDPYVNLQMRDMGYPVRGVASVYDMLNSVPTELSAIEAKLPSLATIAEVQAIVHDETIIIDE